MKRQPLKSCDYFWGRAVLSLERKRSILVKIAQGVTTGFISNTGEAGEKGFGMPTVSFGKKKAVTSYSFPDDTIQGSASAAAAKKPPALPAPTPATQPQWKPKKLKKDPKRFERLMAMVKNIPKFKSLGKIPPMATPKLRSEYPFNIGPGRSAEDAFKQKGLPGGPTARPAVVAAPKPPVLKPLKPVMPPVATR